MRITEQATDGAGSKKCCCGAALQLLTAAVLQWQSAEPVRLPPETAMVLVVFCYGVAVTS